MAVVGLSLGFACGATDLVAPPAQQRSTGEIAQCKSFDQLMPSFVRAIELGKTENLRWVIKDQLLVPARAGDPPPVAEVLRAVFGTLSSFARKPPEPGAKRGELCAEIAPPLSASNELCEIRRAMMLFAHEGKGVEALKLFDPMLTSTTGYILGKSSDGTTHFELTSALSGLFAQDKGCQLNDTLDLVIALEAFLETKDGQAMLQHMDELVEKPVVKNLLGQANPDALGESDMVALSKVLSSAMRSAAPSDLDALLSNPLLSSYRSDLEPIVGDLKKLLDPSTRPSVIVPMRRVLTCLEEKDKNSEAIRMLHRLALRDKRPEFGLTNIVKTLRGVRELDSRGALLHLVLTLATALRVDELGTDSGAKVMSTLLSPRVAAGEVRTNAELALPVIHELLVAGIGYEAICAVDTLIFGCTGGAQPACITR